MLLQLVLSAIPLFYLSIFKLHVHVARADEEVFLERLRA